MTPRRLAVALLLFSTPSQALAGPRIGILPMIYGLDDRIEVFEAELEAQKLSESTVALFKKSDVTISADKTTATLAGEKFGKEKDLVKYERFYDQPAGAFCSGALVGPDLMLTAGHCVENDNDCAKTRFVFGYGIKSKGHDPSKVPASDVYSCKTVVKTVSRGMLGGIPAMLSGKPQRADWAIVRVDRAVTGRKVLELGDASKLAKGTKLLMIGHPSGLPTKVAGGGTVTDDSGATDFKADLDAYAGNSGSPVFDMSTKRIVGVLVRGGKDFVEAGLLTSEMPEEPEGVAGAMLSMYDSTVSAMAKPYTDALGLKRYKSKVERQGKKDSEGVTRVTAIKPTLDAALKDPTFVAPAEKDADVEVLEGLFERAGSALTPGKKSAPPAVVVD